MSQNNERLTFIYGRRNECDSEWMVAAAAARCTDCISTENHRLHRRLPCIPFGWYEQQQQQKTTPHKKLVKVIMLCADFECCVYVCVYGHFDIQFMWIWTMTVVISIENVLFTIYIDAEKRRGPACFLSSHNLLSLAMFTRSMFTQEVHCRIWFLVSLH